MVSKRRLLDSAFPLDEPTQPIRMVDGCPPGGVAPMTVALLICNTVAAAERSAAKMPKTKIPFPLNHPA